MVHKRERKEKHMKTTSEHHGYQIEILTATKDYFWNKGKVYKSHKVAMAMVGR